MQVETNYKTKMLSGFLENPLLLWGSIKLFTLHTIIKTYLSEGNEASLVLICFVCDSEMQKAIKTKVRKLPINIRRKHYP